MNNESKKLIQEYNEQVVVNNEEIYENAKCVGDNACDNLCCLLTCLNCCNSANNNTTSTTTTYTPKPKPTVYADFTNVVDQGAEECSLLTGYNKTTGLYTFYLYSTYMKIAGWNAESQIRTFYKIDYSNISSITTNKPVESNGEYRFFFTINFIKKLNYYVNDNYVGDANLTFFISHCYGNVSSAKEINRYTENFVNQIYRKLNSYRGYEHYKYVKFTEEVIDRYNTYENSPRNTLNERPRNSFNDSPKVEKYNYHNDDNYNNNENETTFGYDYEEEDGYDYGDDE